MKRIERPLWSCLNSSKQLVQNMFSLVSSSHFFLTKYRNTFIRDFGREDYKYAALLINPSRDLKGASRTRLLTQFGKLSANKIEVAAPILRPQSVSFRQGICFLTSLRTFFTSYTSWIPQVRQSSPLLPHPTKSNEATANQNLGTHLVSSRASILDPPLPCRYRTRSGLGMSGQYIIMAEMFTPLSLRMFKSSLLINLPSRVCSRGPNADIRWGIFGGLIIIFHDLSKSSPKIILSIIFQCQRWTENEPYFQNHELHTQDFAITIHELIY